jgi:hypothetical protein
MKVLILLFFVIYSRWIESNPIIDGKLRSELEQIYVTYPDDKLHPEFDHWIQYAQHYEANIQHLKKKQSINMLEMGVRHGGSIFVWKKFWEKNNLTYTGFDIEPKCRQLHNPSQGITVEIGSQLNASFVHWICDQYGPFDFIVDDGGHITDMMVVSFRALWPHCMKDHGVYAIEDTHAMGMFPYGQTYEGKNIYGHISDLMRNRSSYLQLQTNGKKIDTSKPPDNISRHISFITMYDSLIFLHFRKDFKPLVHITRGKKKTIV